MGSTKHEVSETENGAPVGSKPTKKEWVKRHCAKFWWLHLIIFILISLAVILIAIYVAVPAIAQDKINKAKLEIQGIAVENPEPDWYLMSINSTIRTDGQVKATIDPFDGEMYLEDLEPHTPFAKLRFPQTNANKFQVVNVTKQYIEITDRAAFITFNTWFVNNDTLRVTIKGRPNVTPRGLAKSYNVKFEKTLELKGLNNFKGIKVTEARTTLDVKPKNDTGSFRNFYATTEIPNQSHFTLDIGNAVFENWADGVNFGKLYVDNFQLVPGLNTVNATGDIAQDKILEAVAKRPYCTDGIIPFQLIGNNVTNLDGHYLDYFTEALKHSNQVVSINVTDTLIKSDIGITGSVLQCTD